MKFLKDVTFFIRNGASIKQRKGCSGIPITRIETISNGRFNYDHLGYADIFDSDTYKKYYLKDNDVLFSHINSEKFLGRTVLYHPKNKTENIIHGMNLLCLRFNQSEYSPEFFYWYSKSSTAKEFYRINTKHAVNQASIPSSAIKEMPIPDFTLNKQYTIVHSLNQIQSSIDYKLDQITKLDSLVKSRFMEMFGNPISNDKNWPTSTIENCCYMKGLKTIPQKEKYWLLNLDKIESNTGEIIKKDYVTIDEIGNSTFFFDKDYVLYSKLRPYLNKVVVPNESGFGTSELVPLKPNSFVDIVYLAHLLRSESFVKWIDSTSSGAKMPRASVEALRSFTLPLPPIELQNQFADFVHLIDKSRFDQTKKKDRISPISDRIMPV